MFRFFENIKPRFYKKTFYLGKNEIIKFTGNGVKKFLYKLIWIIIVAVMLISMILGGLAITQNQNSQIIQTNTIIN